MIPLTYLQMCCIKLIPLISWHISSDKCYPTFFWVFAKSLKATGWLNIMTINSQRMQRCLSRNPSIFDLFRAIQKEHWLSIWSDGTTSPPQPPRVDSVQSVAAFRACLTWAELIQNTCLCKKSCLLDRLHVTIQQSKQAYSGCWLNRVKCKKWWKK